MISSQPVIAILQIAFLTGFWLWATAAVFFLRTTALPKTGLPCGVDFSACQPVRFQATDGCWLSGWTLRASAAPHTPWIILCHGLGATRADLFDLAEGLRQAGYHLLLFDFRAHGESAGNATSFGWRERLDLEGALAFLGAHDPAQDRPYGVFGVSMGGAVALMTAAEDERLGAVAVESPYQNLHESLGRHLKLLYGLPRWPLLSMIAATYRLRFGAWPAQMSPIDHIGKIGPRPVLIIHGEQDQRVPAGVMRALIQRAQEPKELWTIRGAEHLGGFSTEAHEYLNRLIRFFDGALKTAPKPL